jgi:hypothetical protein
MADIKVVEEKNTVKVNPRDTNVIAIQEIRNYVEVSASGPQGIQGPQGPQGEPGVTVIPIAGTQGQVLAKASATNYDTVWANTVSSVIGGTGLTGGTITTTGTLAVDANVIPYLTASQTFTGTQTMIAGTANTATLIIKGAGGTANVLEIVSTANVVVAGISQTGVLTTNSITSNSLALTKQATSPASPGANTAVQFIKDGTDAGTLKIAIKAGASGAEITLVDNIPTTSGEDTSTLGVAKIEGGSA